MVGMIGEKKKSIRFLNPAPGSFEGRVPIGITLRKS